jgi:hypothetical protein
MYYVVTMFRVNFMLPTKRKPLWSEDFEGVDPSVIIITVVCDNAIGFFPLYLIKFGWIRCF